MIQEYKKRLLFREFSFLAQVLEMCNLDGREPEDNCAWIKSIKVKLADENLMAMSGVFTENNLHFSNEYSFYGKIFFAVAITDNEIYRIPSSGSINDEEDFIKGTVGEELLKEKIIPDYIVSVDARQEKEFKYTADFNIIIYKCGKFDVNNYHEEQFRAAAQQLIIEMRSIK